MKSLVALLSFVVVVGAVSAEGLLGQVFDARTELGAPGWERAAGFAERFTHPSGAAVFEVRQGVLYRASGRVTGDIAGARALASLVTVLRGGDEELRDALEHLLLSQQVVAPFTRVDNVLLGVRSEGEEVLFELEFIEFEPSDFRVSRHAVGEGVVVRAFVDLACEACAGSWALLESLLQQGAALPFRLELHHAPESGLSAVLAAETLECVAAAQADAAWPFALALAADRARWVTHRTPHEPLLEIAAELGVTAPGLEACARDRVASREVAAAAQSARNLGLQSVPTIFAAGIPLRDASSADELQRLVRLMSPIRIEPLEPADPDQPIPDDPEAGAVVPSAPAGENGVAPEGVD